ncbi:hypothetical protein CaCOL14_003532 [Colletotrichum acutatum]
MTRLQQASKPGGPGSAGDPLDIGEAREGDWHFEMKRGTCILLGSLYPSLPRKVPSRQPYLSFSCRWIRWDRLQVSERMMRQLVVNLPVTVSS